MAEVNAEGMNVAAVVETVQGASPPPATDWLNLEADAVGDPGADYKKMARTPYTKTRQLRRPFVSGMDASLKLDLDAIKTHLDFFAEGMFKSAFKHSGNTGQSKYKTTAAVDGGVGVDSFSVPANGAIAAGFLIVTRGFANEQNNDLFVVSAGSGAAFVNVPTGSLVAEAAAPANAELEIAGYQFAAGEIQIDVDGNITSTGKDLTTLGLQLHQFVYLPSQAEATAMGDIKYATDNAAYHGFAEVIAIAAGKITLRRRQWTVGAADPNADNTIRLFFTKWIRNVARDSADELLVSNAFEITYPDLAAGPADAYELLLGYMLDEVTFNIPAEGKVSMSASFIGMTASDPSAVRTAGPAAARNVGTSLALSTAQDFKRLGVDNVDESGLLTDFQDLKITFKNNITGEKAIGHLGNRFTPLGVFEAQTQAQVYFTDPQIVIAVRDERILRLCAGMRNDDFGCVIDIPSTGAMTSKKKIEHNKLITVDTQIAGFMDAQSLFTAGLSMFAYLPKA